MKMIRAAVWLFGATALWAQTPAPATAKLDYVVYLSRHGVRSPLTSNANLRSVSVEAWPEWGIPVGYMTAHGRWLMQLMGGYYREYLLQAGLLSGQSCADAQHFYFWTDTAQRDLESARAIAFAMFPDCKVPVHSYRTGLADPIFSPATAPLAPGIEAVDRVFGAAALGGRIGDNPRALNAPYMAEVELLQHILLGCDAAGPCPRDGKKPKRMLLDDVPQPAPPAAPRDHLAELTATSGQLATVTEAFYLEYVDGMDMKDVGWGRVDEATIARLMTMRAAVGDINLRTPYLARAHASNMLSHILHSMEQSTGATAVPGSLGNPGDRVLMILGHDGDIVPLSGALDISWIAEGYAPNDTPPGSALVFEIWRDTATRKRNVRTYLITETPKAMRDAVPLSLRTPPTKTAVFVPGCSTIAEGYPCDWEAFRKVAEAAIDPAFVAKEPPPADALR